MTPLFKGSDIPTEVLRQQGNFHWRKVCKDVQIRHTKITTNTASTVCNQK